VKLKENFSTNKKEIFAAQKKPNTVRLFISLRMCNFEILSSWDIQSLI
jgi:hypothetical protein